MTPEVGEADVLLAWYLADLQASHIGLGSRPRHERVNMKGEAVGAEVGAESRLKECRSEVAGLFILHVVSLGAEPVSEPSRLG